MAVLSEEQTMLKDAARGWVEARAPIGAYRALRDGPAKAGHDPALWREMTEMGWTAIIVPEAYGGLGFGYMGLGVVLEQLGRTLVASPLLGSALAVPSALVIGGNSEQQRRHLPRLASGDLIAALAFEEGPRHEPHTVALGATLEGTDWVLTGNKRDVLGGSDAGLFVVTARTSGDVKGEAGITLFLVEADAPGLTRETVPQIDRRGAVDLRFDGVKVGPEGVLGKVGGGATLLDDVLDRARAGLAMEMLGAASKAFETTVEYLKTRIQFGKPLGSFQALQHRATDLVAEIELTRSAAEAALAAIDAGAPAAEIAALASLAKLMASETLRRTANEMVQMHGGIGMTDEHDAGLYLKRSRAGAVAFGDAAFHRERFGVLAGF